MKKRILTAFIAFILIGSLAACAPAAQSEAPAAQSTAPAAASAAAPQSSAPAAETPPADDFGIDGDSATVTILMNGDNTPAAENMVLDALGEATNTTINMVYVPSGDKDTKLSTMVAGGEMPDLVTINTNTAKEFKDAGLLADISPYLDSLPNVMADCGNMLDLVPVNNDGIYMIPTSKKPYGDQVCMRTDWLDNLGMSMPTDLDSLYDVYNAFTNNDPDGNGQKDTFGLCANEGLRSFSTVFGAYGIPRESAIILEDNTVTTWVKHPRFLEAVDYIRKLINDGLVEPDWVMIPNMDMFGKLWNGVAGAIEWESVGPTNNWMPARYTEETPPTFGFPTITGPYGDKGVPKKFSDYNSGYVISAAADIKACLRIAEFCKTPEGSDLLYLGIEGVMYNWTDKDNGKYELLGEYTDAATHRANGAFCYWGLFVPGNNAEIRTLNKQTQDGVAAAWDLGLPNTANIIATLQSRVDYGADMDQVIKEMYIELLSSGTADLQPIYDGYIAEWENVGGLDWEKEVNEAWKAQGASNG